MSLLQFELCYDCPNRCDFCSIKGYNRKYSDEEKINSLKKVLDNIRNADWNKYDQLGFVAGEIFGVEYSKELWNAYDDFYTEIIKIIKDKNIKRLYFMTALLQRNSYIPHIIDMFSNENLIDKLMFNTSWDKEYRFNSTTKKIWNENVEYIKSRGIVVHIEMIVANFMIKAYLNDDKELFDIINNYSIDFLRPTVSYGLTKDTMPSDFFLNRKLFFDFYQKLAENNYNLFDDFFNIKKRAETVYSYDLKRKIERDYDNYNEDIDEPVLECGHSAIFSECYEDSNKCIICDIERIKRYLLNDE